jgi:hypothetical protein
MKRIKINGEDIVTRAGHRDIITMAEGRQAAKKISASKNHAWANIYYLYNGVVARETWYNGKPYRTAISTPAMDLNLWFTAKKTVREAMIF